MPAANSKNATPRRWAERLGRLRRGLDVGDAVRMQGHGGGQHDEERHQVRERHSYVRIDLDAVKVGLGLLGRLAQRLFAVGGALLFHFLRSLPEEQVRADRGAEHGHEREQIIRAQRDIRDERVQAGLEPRHTHHEHRRDVGEERERQPLQERRVPGKGNEDLQSERNQRERDDIEARRASDEQLQAAAIAPRSAAMLIVLATSRSEMTA